MATLQSVVAALAGLALSGAHATSQSTDLRAVFMRLIDIERTGPVTAVPLKSEGGKLFIRAAVNGQEREFFFDTGSPTILTREFAKQLGLKVVGQNTGVDANGTPVTMDVAVVDSLTIGGTTFSGVPVFIHDFSGLGTGACLVDGGFIGSELFPGSAWRIDTAQGRLTIAASVSALEPLQPAVEARLYDFGYPHAPVVDYALGEVTDKAMFDTGNSEAVTLFREVADNPSVRSAIEPGSLRQGRGHEGESAGGRGEAGPLMRFTLRDFRLGGEPLGPVEATTRSVPPTLVGAGTLAAHVVTLDYPGGRFEMTPRSRPAPRRAHGGYAVLFGSETAVVAQLYEDSPAAKAGLRLGDRVAAIGGRSLVISPDNPKCDVVKWLVTKFDPSRETEIVVQRAGGQLTLHIPALQADGESASR